jgi:hypothetical protein
MGGQYWYRLQGNRMWDCQLASVCSGQTAEECSYEHSNEHCVSWKERNFLTSWATKSFSRRTVINGVILLLFIVFQELGLLACSGFRTYFSETYESIWTVGRTPWTGDRPNARPLPTQDNTTQTKADTQPCLEWGSNPWSQCFGLQYVPQTARPLGLAIIIIVVVVVVVIIITIMAPHYEPYKCYTSASFPS